MFLKLSKKAEKNREDIYRRIPPDYWDNSYKNNVLQRLWYDLRFRAMKKILKRLPIGSNILDVGCGSGFAMQKSIPEGKNFEIYGVDVTEDLINYAKEKRPQFHFQMACGENLPFEEKKFDAVLYNDVIEHLIDPVKSLQEAHRTLKPDGFVAVLVVKENHPLFQIIWWFWEKLKGKIWEEAHVSIYDEKSLRKQMESVGFNVTEMKNIHLGMSLAAVAYKSRFELNNGI